MVEFKASKLPIFGGIALLFFSFVIEYSLVLNLIKDPCRENVILLVAVTLIFGGWVAFFGVYLICSYFRTTKHLRQGLQKYGKENLIDKIQNHCISAYKHPVTGNMVYFTEDLIIAPKETIIDYNEIAMMYKQVTSTNGIRHQYLAFALNDGTVFSLCEGIADAMIHNYMQLCFQHNAGIIFGYTKENQQRYKELVKEYKRNHNGK